MSEAIVSRGRRTNGLRSMIGDLAWSVLSPIGLNGLYGGELQEHWFMLEKRELYLPNLGREFDGARIIHISDLHLSPFVRERQLDKILNIVTRLESDFVVITGDFITATLRHYARRVGKALYKLASHRTTLACLGNHDYGLWHPVIDKEVRGLSGYVAAQLRAAGVVPLMNESHTFSRGESELHFVGVADFWSASYEPDVAFAKVVSAGPVLALCHNPNAAPDLAAKGADYVMSGHTHGRSTSDFWLSKFFRPAEIPELAAGEYSVGGGRVYVNRGIGHGRRVTSVNRPEITQFTLRRHPVS